MHNVHKQKYIFKIKKPQTKSNKKHKKDIFFVYKNLGNGTYGNVWLASHHGNDVALKLMSKKLLNYVTAYHEHAMLKQVAGCRYVVTCLDFFETDNDAIIVLEAMETDLHNLLRGKDKKHLKIQTRLDIFRQVVLGVMGLHRRNVIHRDLKLENVLVTRRDKHQYDVKLCDFGWACLDGSQKCSGMAGTPAFHAPEMYNYAIFYGKPIDIWQLGVLLYDMLFGKTPFEHKSIEETNRRIRDVKYTIPTTTKRKSCPQVEHIIQESLVKDPKKRCTLKQMLYWLEYDNIL